MNVATIFLVAAVGGVFAFSRDIFRAWSEGRKARRQKRSNDVKEPLEISALVVDDVAQSVTLQSAVLVQVRLSLADSEKRRQEAEDRASKLDARVATLEAEKLQLYIALGKAHTATGQ